MLEEGGATAPQTDWLRPPNSPTLPGHENRNRQGSTDGPVKNELGGGPSTAAAAAALAAAEAGSGYTRLRVHSLAGILMAVSCAKISSY